jgi:hypothetical protein
MFGVGDIEAAKGLWTTDEKEQAKVSQWLAQIFEVDE